MVTAGLRLDDALRGYLAEQGSKRIRKEQLWRLVGGSLRLRLTANALAGMPRGAVDADGARMAFAREVQGITSWYEHLAVQVGRPGGDRGVSLRAPEVDGTDAVELVSEGARGCWTVWVQEHLHHLSEHMPDLVAPAKHVAAIRRRPWWR
ncbi:MAG: hypothetical protein JO372_07860 [Solirubrobacterales bacterium]|nr:hypothetical protein [Solirubrobacterales bacterium]